MFMGGNGMGDALLTNWVFAVQHPEALVGITTVSGGACQPETDHYSMHVTPSDPNVLSCVSSWRG